MKKYFFMFFFVLTCSLFADSGDKHHNTYLGLGYGYDIAFKNATFDGVAGSKVKQAHTLALISETYFNNTPFGLYVSIGTGKSTYMKIETKKTSFDPKLFLTDSLIDTAFGATVKYDKNIFTFNYATNLSVQYANFMSLYTEIFKSTGNQVQKFYSETSFKMGLEALLETKIHTGKKWFFGFGLIGRWNFLDTVYPAGAPILFSTESLKTSFNVRPRISSGAYF